jgi:hypothetical protein
MGERGGEEGRRGEGEKGIWFFCFELEVMGQIGVKFFDLAYNYS